MNIDTILFDMDGTLIDTNELIMESFRHTFTHYGYRFTDEAIREFNGPPLIDTFREINDALANEMVSTYRAHNLAHHDHYVAAFPEVRETLATLQESGIRMGVVSAKMRTGVELGLKTTEIRRFFETVVAVDDVIHAKPHPESVLKAMNALDGEAETTLMVGDNYHDIEAGKNAGIQTAGVAWSAKGAAYLSGFKPTYMLTSMKDLIAIIN